MCAISPGWIIIEFNNEWEFEEIEIGGYNGDTSLWRASNGSNATIFTSKDKTTWTSVGNIPSGYGASIIDVKLQRSFAKYIKFVGTSYLGIGFLEIKKFNK